MKKIVVFLLIPFLILIVISVYKETSKNSYPSNIKVIEYDVDDFAAYLEKNCNGENTNELIEAYLKDKSKHVKKVIIDLNDPNLYEIIEKDGKKIKTAKKIKTVIIDNYQKIDFYANGSIGVGIQH